MKHTYLLLFIFLVAGCSSPLKKQCKRLNWYKHGKNIALSGENIHSDNFASRCEQKEVFVNHKALKQGYKDGNDLYCEEQNVFTNAKIGRTVNLNMCPAEKQKKLRLVYAKGLRLFCQPEKGYAAGSKGMPLNPKCPEDMSKEYHQQYLKGRKLYLNEAVKNSKPELAEIRLKLKSKKKELTSKKQAFEAMDTLPISGSQKYGMQNQVLELARATFLKKRAKLEAEVNQLSQEVYNLESQEQALKDTVLSAQTELKSLN